jgi:hypothetical protein
VRYEEFRNLIRSHLRAHPKGATWPELKEELNLPQRTACYSWIYRMESEIGLRRERSVNGMVWRLGKPRRGGS